jgi:hypothetical protein
MNEELRSQLWSAANNIDDLKNRVQNAADVMEVIASSETEPQVSGALWFVRDSMKILCEWKYYVRQMKKQPQRRRKSE